MNEITAASQPMPERPTGVDPAIWDASWSRRLARRVRRPDSARFAFWGEITGSRQARIELTPCRRLEAGVLMFKAGTVATPEAAQAVAERLDEVGYAASQVRLVSPTEIRAHGLIRRHYAGHWRIAQAYTLTPEERVRLLDVYEGPAFEALAGRAAAACEVIPAFAFAEREGIDPSQIAEWSAAASDRYGLSSGMLDGPNELSDLCCVHLLRDVSFHHGPPVFLLNPHMLTVAGWYERAVSPMLAALVVADTDNALPWKRLRQEVCGRSDPTTAEPGSMRRDMHEGILPLEHLPGFPPGRFHNGVHLSNGPIEALREAAIWFGVAPSAWRLGRALIERGGWTEAQLLEATRVEASGYLGLLVDRTNGMSPEEAIAFLNSAAPADGLVGTSDATTRRVDIAWRAAREIATDPGVVAVFATGSVAQARCSEDSDIDLVAIYRDERSVDPETPIERTRLDEIVVEVERISRTEAIDRASAPGGDMRSLKRASRLGLALALVDAERFGPELARLARELRPDPVEIAQKLISARSALDEALEAHRRAGVVDRDALHRCCDALAYVLLASSARRYQKPKWVLDDLRRLGEEEARTAIIQCYGVSSDGQAVRRSLDRVRTALDAVAVVGNMPRFEEARARGLIPEFPVYSYVCQCLADAESLLRDGLVEDADFAGRFTARMAIAMLDRVTLTSPVGAPALIAYSAVCASGDGGDAEPPLSSLRHLLETAQRRVAQ